ncbi:MAG: outer membrane lipoprotein-sorting protein [Alphaproteobacteria bacterium]
MKNKILICAGVLLLSTTAVEAKTAAEILSAGGMAEDIGLAIAVEADQRDAGFKDSQAEMEMILRNKRGQETKRKLRSKIFEMKNPKVGDKSMSIFDNPRDVKGTAFLTHSKILEPDNQWLYLPALKRVKRISSRNKSGPFMGSEFAYEDMGSQEVPKYSYKFIGKKTCGSMECLISERTPLYENSGYTKQVIWIDTQHFRPQKIEYYDRKKSLLKILSFYDYKEYLGKYWRSGLMKMKNHQTGKETDLFFKNYRFKTGLRQSAFTKAKLKNVR